MAISVPMIIIHNVYIIIRILLLLFGELVYTPPFAAGYVHECMLYIIEYICLDNIKMIWR